MLKPLTYPVRIVEEAPGEFVATFADIPEALTGAATYDDTLAQAADALSVAIEGILLDDRFPATARPAQVGEIDVPVAPATAALLSLYRALSRRGLSGRSLASLLGKDEKNVRRMLAGRASLDQVLVALGALGVRPAMAFEPELEPA